MVTDLHFAIDIDNYTGSDLIINIDTYPASVIQTAIDIILSFLQTFSLIV